MPSKHSSSSHSSSSSSDSSGSSSHGSHSSHSSSSHSSSYSSSESSRSSHSYSSHSSGADYQKQPKRTRVNQPKGWNSETHGKPIDYKLKDHDYQYYPREWTDNEGKHYRAGYYDENGQYYRNVVAKDIETMLTCSYCGNHMYYKWHDGAVPTCPACSAPFEIDKIDYYTVADNFKNGKRPMSPWMIFAIIIGLIILSPIILVFVIMLFTLLIALIMLPFGGLKNLDTKDVTPNQSNAVIEQSHQPQSVFVEEIGRTCTFDSEFEDYYDADTKCWFWFNTDLEPAQWQYWYDSISSDFGEYGWMEYDDEKQIWYIEASENNWVPVDTTKYDTSSLWHFNNAYKNDLY